MEGGVEGGRVAGDVLPNQVPEEVKPAARPRGAEPSARVSGILVLEGAGLRSQAGAQHHPRRERLSFPKSLFSVDIQPKEPRLSGFLQSSDHLHGQETLPEVELKSGICPFSPP